MYLAVLCVYILRISYNKNSIYTKPTCVNLHYLQQGKALKTLQNIM
jgi:hypothetical protein